MYIHTCIYIDSLYIYICIHTYIYLYINLYLRQRNKTFRNAEKRSNNIPNKKRSIVLQMKEGHGTIIFGTLLCRWGCGISLWLLPLDSCWRRRKLRRLRVFWQDLCLCQTRNKDTIDRVNRWDCHSVPLDVSTLPYTHTLAHTHSRARAHTHTFTHTHIHEYTHTRLRAHTHTHTHTTTQPHTITHILTHTYTYRRHLNKIQKFLHLQIQKLRLLKFTWLPPFFFGFPRPLFRHGVWTPLNHRRKGQSAGASCTL